MTRAESILKLEVSVLNKISRVINIPMTIRYIIYSL